MTRPCACGASGVGARKFHSSQAMTAKHPSAISTIQPGDMSVSVSVPVPSLRARDADSVETTPLTTGPMSLSSVHTEATAMRRRR